MYGGPLSILTHYGFMLFLTIIDDHSRSTWVYLMKSKSNVRHIINSFYILVLTQFNAKIQNIRTDNSTRFNMYDLFNSKCIIHQKCCVETPRQNSIVEHKHQHIFNVAKALKFQSNVLINLWGECILTATYVINRIPSPVINNLSPHEV